MPPPLTSLGLRAGPGLPPLQKPIPIPVVACASDGQTGWKPESPAPPLGFVHLLGTHSAQGARVPARLLVYERILKDMS